MSPFASPGLLAASTCAPADCISVPANIAFGVMAALMIFAAVQVVTTKNVVHAALWLVIVLGGVGANYILLQAEFVAITQFLVYIGAIIVLFLFGIMLTRAPLGRTEDLDNNQRAIGVVVGVILAAVLGYSLISEFSDTKVAFAPYAQTAAVGAPRSESGSTSESDPGAQTRTEVVSDSIFSEYLLPFEVVSVLLLAALIGAIVLARRD